MFNSGLATHVASVAWLALLVAWPTPAAAEQACTPVSLRLDQAGFTQLKVREGVQVFRRAEAGTVHFAAEAILALPLDSLFDVLMAYDAQRGQLPRLAESRVLERADGRLVVYQRLALPVVSDRDYTLLVTSGRRGDVRWIHYTAANHLGPPVRDGIVRVPTNDGSWQLVSLGDARTLVRFEHRTDFAGALPGWMVRSGAARELPRLFAALERLAR